MKPEYIEAVIKMQKKICHIVITMYTTQLYVNDVLQMYTCEGWST